MAIANTIANAGATEVNKRSSINGKIYHQMPLSHLRRGMHVLVEEGGKVVEAEVECGHDQSEYQGPVYDLEVAPAHTYVANGVLVQNSIFRFRGADMRNILTSRMRLRKQL